MLSEQALDSLIDDFIAGKPASVGAATTAVDPMAAVLGRLAHLNELQPRAEAKAEAHRLILARAETLSTAVAQPSTSTRTPIRTWLRRRLTTAVAAGMALTLASGGTVYAASGSVPGDLLYPVKRATETVNLALTPPGLARAQAEVDLARVRLAEIKALMERKDKRRIGLLIKELNRRLASARAESSLTAAEALKIKAVADSLGRSARPFSVTKPKPKKRQVPVRRRTRPGILQDRPGVQPQIKGEADQDHPAEAADKRSDETDKSKSADRVAPMHSDSSDREK